MAWFSKKEDTRYIKEFDEALSQIATLGTQFRESHFKSLELFNRNFEKEKAPTDLHKERELFEMHMELLQKLKFQTDLLIDEAFKIVKNETALTEKDRVELKKIVSAPPAKKTDIAVEKK